jgi:hypothetical protein
MSAMPFSTARPGERDNASPFVVDALTAGASVTGPPEPSREAAGGAYGRWDDSAERPVGGAGSSAPGHADGSWLGEAARELAIGDPDGTWTTASRGHDHVSPTAQLDRLTPPAVPPPSSSFVPADPPNPRMSKPGPLGRPCCMLSAASLVGIDTLSTTSYAARQPGTLYTGRAGFVDLGHLWAVVEATAYAYQEIHAAKGAAGTTFGTPEGEATLTSTAPRHEWLELARSIAYDDALAHEIITFDVMLPGGHNSSFSPEDLPSNYLGAALAAAVLVIPNPTSPKGSLVSRPRWTFAAKAESELRRLLASLDAQTAAETKKAFALIANRWVDAAVSTGSSAYLKRRNFTPRPWHAGHASDATPPTWLGAPFRLTASYDYRHAKGLTRASFPAMIAAIKAKAASKDPQNYNKP